MSNKKPFRNSSTFNFLFDMSVLFVLFWVFIDLQYKDLGFYFPYTTLISLHYKALILLLFSWYFISKTFKIYTKDFYLNFLVMIRKLIITFFVFSIIIFAVSGLKTEDLFSVKLGVGFLLSLFLIILIQRMFFFFSIKRYYRKNIQKNAVVLGKSEQSELLEHLLENRLDYGIGVVKTIERRENWIGELNKILNKYDIEYLYITLKRDVFYEEEMSRIQEIAENKRMKVFLIPDSVMATNFHNLSISYYDTLPVMTYGDIPLEKADNRFIKRAFDIFFTLAFFVLVLSWLMPLLALAIYISQGAPVFYIQKRNGMNGKEFGCIKFRTMRPHKSNDKKPTERDDPRVTKLGRILRKTSLDELPQFFNVLKGDMSIVGPRPHMVSENESYSEIIRRYSLRHYVKPGITGLAQIRGYRGAIDDTKDMELRVRTDIYYVRNWSFLLDLFILYKTFMLMIKGDENAI